MELRINPLSIPAVEWNKDEINKELEEKIGYYENLVFNDDEIKEAKKERANLNKLYTALDNRRKEVKNEYLNVYGQFEDDIKTSLAVVKRGMNNIDGYIKDFDAKKKAQKEEDIKALYAGVAAGRGDKFTPELSKIWGEKWLNASYSLGKVSADIDDTMKEVDGHIETLSKLPEFGFEAVEAYKDTLDVNRALNEAQRMAEIAKKKQEEEEARKRAAEVEALKATMPAPAEDDNIEGQVSFKDNSTFDKIVEDSKPEEPQVFEVKFGCRMTLKQAEELKRFFAANQIEFWQV